MQVVLPGIIMIIFQGFRKKGNKNEEQESFQKKTLKTEVSVLGNSFLRLLQVFNVKKLDILQ